VTYVYVYHLVGGNSSCISCKDLLQDVCLGPIIPGTVPEPGARYEYLSLHLQVPGSSGQDLVKYFAYQLYEYVRFIYFCL